MADARGRGRPSRWGNPWRVGLRFLDSLPLTAEEAVQLYRERMPTWRQHYPEMLNGLRGATALVCWCPLAYPDGSPYPCHADVLLELLGGRA